MQPKTSASCKVIVEIMKLDHFSSRDVLSGILERQKTSTKVEITVLQENENPLTAERVRSAGKNGVSGIILTRTNTPEVMNEIAVSDIPVVAVGVDHPSLRKRRHPTVLIKNDNHGIGIMGAEHFLSKGKFSSFGFVLNRPADDWSKERQKAFSKKISGSLARPRIYTFQAVMNPDSETNTSALEKWLKDLPKPAAVMAACDRLAMFVRNACKSSGIDIPDAVALLGVDNDVIDPAFDTPEISSILPGHKEMGRCAARELERLMLPGARKKRWKELTVAPQSLIIRKSSALRTPSAALVEHAQRFIKAKATEGIDVPDVVEHLKVSRRLLEIRYRAVTGTTVRSDIEITRMTKLKHLLSTTDRPISLLAGECGFRNQAALANRFKKLFGSTMNAFRSAERHRSDR